MDSFVVTYTCDIALMETAKEQFYEDNGDDREIRLTCWTPSATRCLSIAKAEAIPN